MHNYELVYNLRTYYEYVPVYSINGQNYHTDNCFMSFWMGFMNNEMDNITSVEHKLVVLSHIQMQIEIQK